MKIAVLSSYSYICKVNNYGSLLQYFALQTYLEKQGHTVFWIRLISKKKPPTGINRWLREKILKSNFKIDNIPFYNKKGFEDFIQQYIHLSENEYQNFSDLKMNLPKADLFVVGSDQVWNGFAPERYLMFVPKNIPKISYAVSFGRNSIRSYLKPLVRYYLKDFKAISIREMEGVQLCKSLGRKDTRYTIDPSFLLSKEEYIDILNQAHLPQLPYKNFIYGYFVNPFINNEFPFKDEIRQLADNNEKQFIVTAIQNAEKALTEYHIVQPSPLEWIQHIIEAQAILTNSFHGVAYAINLQKPFLLLLQTGEMSDQNCRYLNLLKRLNLTNRIYSKRQGNIKEQLYRPIDWDKINKLKNEFIKESISFLQENI